MEPGRSVRIARRSDRRFGVRSLRAASMLVKKTSSLRCTRALLRVDPSRALNVWRNVAIASPSGLILIVSVLAISFLRSRVAHRTQSRLRAVHVEEVVRLLDVSDVPVQERQPKVRVSDATATDQAIQTLMGRDVAPRFEFIMERAPRVEQVDL